MKIPFRKYWSLQKTYLKPYKRKVVLLTICLLSSILLQLLNPQVIRYYIDTFGRLDERLISLSAADQQLIVAALLYFGIAFVQQIFYVSSVYISQNLAWNSTNQLREDFAEHCIKLDMTFQNEHKPGEFIERIDGDVTNLSNFFSQFMILVGSNILLIIGILLTLYSEDALIGISFTIFTALTLITLYLIWNIASPFWKKVREKSADLFGQIEEHLSGKEDLIALNASAYTLKRFHLYSKEEYDLTYKAIVVSRMIHIMIMGMVALGSTLVFVIAIPLHETGVVTIGTIFLLNSYVGLLFNPIINIVRQTQNLTQADASIDRINEFLEIKTKIIAISDKNHRPIHHALSSFVGPATLEFDRISFAYKEETVLDNISYSLEAGHILGLIGRTGSGKTTISRLIFRLYNPTAGSVRFNGIDITNIPVHELRGKIAYVTQKVELFKASIRDNISLFDKTVSDNQILEAIKGIGLYKWYESLPDGLDTNLKEIGFSAGEAQLLAITRVFLRDPALVILDEASSRLDPVTERLIEHALDRLLHNRTALIIAHRLKTLDRADTILHLEKGRIIEFGERKKLISDPQSNFFQLLKKGQIMEVLV